MDLSTKTAGFRDFYRQLSPDAQEQVSKLADIIESVEQDGISNDELLTALARQIPTFDRKHFGPLLQKALGLLTDGKVDADAAQTYGAMSASIYDTSPARRGRLTHLDGVALHLDDRAGLESFRKNFTPDLSSLEVNDEPGVPSLSVKPARYFDEEALRQILLLADTSGKNVYGADQFGTLRAYPTPRSERPSVDASKKDQLDEALKTVGLSLADHDASKNVIEVNDPGGVAEVVAMAMARLASATGCLVLCSRDGETLQAANGAALVKTDGTVSKAASLPSFEKVETNLDGSLSVTVRRGLRMPELLGDIQKLVLRDQKRVTGTHEFFGAFEASWIGTMKPAVDPQNEPAVSDEIKDSTLESASWEDLTDGTSGLHVELRAKADPAQAVKDIIRLAGRTGSHVEGGRALGGGRVELIDANRGVLTTFKTPATNRAESLRGG